MVDNGPQSTDEESSFDSEQHEVPGSNVQGSWPQIKFDWATICAIGLIVLGIATLLWNAIENVDDDVNQLTNRVNQIDDKLDERMGKIGNKFDERMEKIAEKMDIMTDDIAFIKGRIKNISSSAKNNTGQKLLSVKGNVYKPAREMLLNPSIQRK